MNEPDKYSNRVRPVTVEEEVKNLEAFPFKVADQNAQAAKAAKKKAEDTARDIRMQKKRTY